MPRQVPIQKLIENELRKLSKSDLSTAERIKVLNLGIKWVAVTSKIGDPDEGAGYLDDPEDEINE